MLYFVDELLSLGDNIIDQLILLKKFKHNRDVKKYMNSLKKENLSPYTRYCINKYFYGLDVEEEKIPDSYYPTLTTYNNKYVEKLIGNIPNFRDQVLKLKKYKDKEAVIDFVSEKFPYYLETNPYARNIILIYYYDVPIAELEPSAKSLHITLWKVYFPKLEKKQEKKKERLIKKNLKHLKVGDEILLCADPFTGMEGILLEKSPKLLKVEIDLFGQKTVIDLESTDEVKKVRKKK